MSEEKMMRLGQVARKLNVGVSTIVESMAKKGFEVESNPNSKISSEHYNMLAKEFKSSAQEKEEASHLSIGKRHNENFTIKAESESEPEKEIKKPEPKKPVSTSKPASAPPPAEEKKAEEKATDKISNEAPKLQGIKVLGKIDLDGNKSKSKPAEVKEEPKPSTPKPVAEEPKKPEPKPEAKKEPEVKAEPKKEKEQPQKAAPKAETTTPKPTPTPEKTEKPVAKTPPAPKAEEKATPPKKAPEAKPEAPKEPTAQSKPNTEEKATTKEPEKPIEKTEDKVISAKADSLKGLTVLGKIELPKDKPKKKSKPVASSDERNKEKKKRPRKRIDNRPAKSGDGARNTPAGRGQGGQGGGGARKGNNRGGVGRPGGRGQNPRFQKEEPTQKEIQDQIKQTLARLQGGGKSGGRGKNRRDKRSERTKEVSETPEESKILRVTEFISANDLASLMDVSVNEVISVCMGLGMFVSINQRLDAEAITIIADEFHYDVEFTKTDEEETEVIEEENEDTLIERAPIVTIMGHVDHGKTSLLDYIRRAKVTHGEAGGITQHIGAYDVETSDGHKIAFLDTPGHEAFTAMRARGAKITDVAIIVIAADDNVMPQTKEAINHAQVAGVPMIFAINKIDRPNSNPEKIKEELANMNLLVEDWGGKYQSQDISAKTGVGIDELLEKVLLESEILELKANPNKNAVGTVVEASLDKGRGYVSTIMVQAGTLHVGDTILAGQHYGRVKAMFDHLGKKVEEAGPSTPVQVLGLGGAPQAGDVFKVYDSEREAREIANSREQIQREQSLRTKKHITLDEIGRRLAIGSFKELNIIIKGDVDGSVEALSDSLLKLSKDEVNVNIIHNGVGQISESDVLLASASDAIILGFQVRPSVNAKRLAEQEEIEIRHYSIIYDAINQIKDAIEGMLEPEFEEVITGNIEVREVFKISKVGTVAGCYVTDGYINRKNKIRIIRDGIVIHEGEISALKRFKDDVSEVKYGYECGVSIKGFNDIQQGDTFEGYKMEEVKRKK
ncbi:translation initiation factor IF-2 [Cyclobacterium marinum]|uniref:Translation initiation factor IF-2 n=1 Tax=Cyclobacterium marinum (strain ATCC 25205 / DSM 745 / LMG 13164 / NCIMB 1802) TaxID=880070 RepID=G0IYF4_CYCMS|nr:translation initiation factor IF-2 [Cyclobacterium marinum]AEL25689.1 translation initiation factor IF-2 [Cyclobacterium marinum DSM 745]